MRARSFAAAALLTAAACAPAATPPAVPITPVPCPVAIAPPPPAPAPLPPAAPDTPAEHALAQLFADAWEDSLREDPIEASLLGERRYNDRWAEETDAAFDRRHAHAIEFLARVRAIAEADLSPASQLNRALFERQYALEVEGYDFGLRYLPLDQRDGIQSAGDVGGQLRFTTLQDYEDWMRRIETFPALVAQTIGVMREGIKRHIVHPRVVMDRVPAQIDRQIVAQAEDSSFFRPFAAIPPAVPAADAARLTTAARAAILKRVVPAYRTLATFLAKEYLPACRSEVGLWQIPRGDEAYRYLIKLHTSTNMSPEDVHALGEREVARIEGEMQVVMDGLGFKGTRKDFFAKLRTDPRFFIKDPAALLEAYRDVAKRVDPLLVKLFKTLPRTPYGVLPIPATTAPDTTAAYYMQPAEDGSRAGTYYVNLYKPETRPIWEMIPLTLHESVPGHHLQFALALEHTEFPQFRRTAYYTMFSEGWGLYAESLGEDMGLYDDPYAKFGQLAYEMWRAIRLVVDTGMHAMKWDRQKAIDYFMDNDPKVALDVTNEIDRYIVMPGQALSYKLGELKFKELRARAKEKLGPKFDLRELHDVMLEEGGLPLDLLDKHVDEWIEKKAGN